MTITNAQRKFRSDFGVYVCDHIFKGESPVVFVVRDEETSWQFLCGDALDDDPCHHVGVGHVIDSDHSLEVMANLPTGHYAERESAESPWVYGELDE
jgi:hypothetical protein